MRQRNVVTSFIAERTGNEITQIVLFKRSTAVRNHKELWAGCSGSIEPGDTDALDRAWTELHEETGLTSRELILVRRGEPLVIADTAIDTQFTIHPFLFELKSPEWKGSIKINWEHSEFRWVRPEELSEYQTSPALQEVLQRVMGGEPY